MIYCATCRKPVTKQPMVGADGLTRGPTCHAKTHPTTKTTTQPHPNQLTLF